MNGRIIKYTDGREVKVEVLFTFKIEDLNNEYVAYLLNDNGISENANVYISQLMRDENQKMVVEDIKNEEIEAVMTMYNQCKKELCETLSAN